MENLYRGLPIARIAACPLRYFDIGSRGGFQDDLLPLAFAVDAVGFEPDPEAFEALRDRPAGPWRSATVLPVGIGPETGAATLHVPADPQSASLMAHDPAIGRKFDKPQFFEPDRTERIETLSLSDALARSGFDAIDYLKIDIEGPELDVLRASPVALRDRLALKTEVSFVPFRVGQPLAADMDLFLRQAGFELMDITGPAHWRRQGYLIHPWYSAGTPPYAKGQIVQADFLYFRDPASLGDDPDRLFRLALVCLAFGYFDHALMILERPAVRAALHERFGLSPAQVVVPASRRYGRRAFLRAFRRQARGLVPFARYLPNLRR